MPWRNPEWWTPFVGPLLAMAVAILRVLYDRKETRALRILLEGLLCGLITLAASKGISAMGLNEDWSIVAGGLIGLMGSEFVRYSARRIIRDRTPRADK